MSKQRFSHGETVTLRHNQVRDKVEKYDWRMKDAPGSFQMVAKARLLIDDEAYQREATEIRALSIAQNWSWVACGALIVAKRANGDLFVMDGQHRKIAADRRSDIRELPCLVFETESVEKEAQGFLDANTLRRPMNGAERFKAQRTTNTHAAIVAQELVAAAGRAVGKTSSMKSLGCITLLMRLIDADEACIRRLWPLLTDLTEGHLFHEQILSGLFEIESHLPPGESIARGKWAERLSGIGYEGLMQAISKARAYHNKGGARIFADGILTAINKGLTHRLVLAGKDI